MLSRVAETIYWMGRYLERAENTARLINVNSNLMLDLPKGVTLGWKPLVRILGYEEAYKERHDDEITERRVVNFLLTDETNSGSILSTLSYARENARTIREILPREGWEELNTLYQYAIDAKQSSYSRQGRRDYLLHIINNLQSHVGLLAGTMNHGTAYSFLNLGRKLERAEMTTRIINIKTEQPILETDESLGYFKDILWMTILENLGAYQMYRQSMQARSNRIAVLTFLFHKSEFPRSLAYCMENIHYNIKKLPNHSDSLKVLEDFKSTVKDVAITELDDQILHDFIDELQVSLGHLHNAIANTYFPKFEEQAT